MQFVEYANGTPVSGTLVHDIWSFAKSIWQGFYGQGMTPEIWGSMLRAVEDEYICEMETKWPMLCCCDNHWKVNFLVTQTYFQWYCQYDNKMKKLKANAAKLGGNKPAAKKCRIMTEKPNSEPSPPSEVQGSVAPTPIHKTSFRDKDINKLLPPQVKEQQLI